MGYMRHHAIIVTGYSHCSRLMEAAHAFAVEAGCSVTRLTDAPVNGYTSFVVLPDGSKEGWPESDLGDKRREHVVGWLDAQRYEDGSSPLSWVEIRYGDDDDDNGIDRDEADDRTPGTLDFGRVSHPQPEPVQYPPEPNTRKEA